MDFFPDTIVGKSSSPLEMTMEDIAGKFDYFQRQIHLLHFQTPSYSEHKGLQIWDILPGQLDEFLEKIMGYEGRKIKSYSTPPIVDYSMELPKKILTDLKEFAKQLESYGRLKNYSDIENLAQSLSGSASQVLYLLTLS
jgi:hypothetical protein